MRRRFTLVELIVAVVTVAMLASIVVVNTKDTKEGAYIASVNSNVNSIQVAADTYRESHDGEFPTVVSPSMNDPQQIDFAKLYPDTLRTLPKTKGITYWIDHTGIVWATSLSLPENLRYEGDAYTWDSVEGATSYQVYEMKEVETTRVLGRVLKLKVPYKNLGKTKKSKFEIDKGTPVLVTANDRFGFETPPSAKLSVELQDDPTYQELKDISPDVSMNGNQKPVARIGGVPDVVYPTTGIVWTSLSDDPDGDRIVDEEWANKRMTYPENTEQQVSLRVMDEHGAWSDWATVSFGVIPEVKAPETPITPPTPPTSPTKPVPPVANRKPLAMIDILVTQDTRKNNLFDITSKGSTDPDGDLIVEEEWRNRSTAYHHAGKQEVYLRVKDARGLWSDWACKQIKLTGSNKPPQISTCSKP